MAWWPGPVVDCSRATGSSGAAEASIVSGDEATGIGPGSFTLARGRLASAWVTSAGPWRGRSSHASRLPAGWVYADSASALGAGTC